MATVDERLEKASKKLEELRARKKNLDDAIKKAEADVAKYQEIINRAKYDKLSDGLRISGITLDDVIDALESGNVNQLQGKLKRQDGSDQ